VKPLVTNCDWSFIGGASTGAYCRTRAPVAGLCVNVLGNVSQSVADAENAHKIAIALIKFSRSSECEIDRSLKGFIGLKIVRLYNQANFSA
jgi:hypothetical protein